MAVWDDPTLVWDDPDHTWDGYALGVGYLRTTITSASMRSEVTSPSMRSTVRGDN